MISRTGFVVLCAAALLSASAIARATRGAAAGGPALVTVGDGPGAVATGFAVSPGRAVTVAHVLDARAVTVRGDDGIARRATVLRRDERLDLALLAVPGLRAAPPGMAGGARLLVRRDEHSAALPVRVLRRVNARVRQAGAATVAVRPALELAAAVAPGDSGAPVVRDGRVVGVVFARSRDRAGVAYAVEASALGFP
jgi:S1-C subfamily serine protease